MVLFLVSVAAITPNPPKVDASHLVRRFAEGIYASRTRENLPPGTHGSFDSESRRIPNSSRLRLSGSGGVAIVHTERGLIQGWKEQRAEGEDRLDGRAADGWNESAAMGEGRAIRLAQAYYARSGRRLPVRLEKVSRGQETPNCYALVFRPARDGYPVLDSWYTFEIGYRSGRLVSMDLADDTPTDAPPILPRASRPLPKERLKAMAIAAHRHLTGLEKTSYVGSPEIGYYVPKGLTAKGLTPKNREGMKAGRAILASKSTVISATSDGSGKTKQSRIYLEASTGRLIEADVSDVVPLGQGIGGH